MLLINAFSALATGGAVATAQYLGKQERDNAGCAAKQLFYVILLVSYCAFLWRVRSGKWKSKVLV